ncbi:MAG: potassium channel family protein [Haloarculaceae archaeon]
MAPLPVQVLLGVYLGILTGVIPALVAWALGFGFKYFTGVTIPGFGVVVLAIALAGVSGGLLALADPTVTQSANAPTVVTGILVVTAIALYAHAEGDQLGARLPRRLSLSSLRERRLPRDLAEFVGGHDEVRIRVAGDVADLEGYPPLSPALRAAVRAAEYTLPADLTVSELESRVAERLRGEFDLADATVAIDDRGRATVAAAPSFSGISKHVPAGERAVSVDALVPTGIARGDEVTLQLDDGAVSGTVVSARSGDGTAGASQAPAPASEPAPTPSTGSAAADGDAQPAPGAVRAPTTTGGEGRVTAAVARNQAERLVAADGARVVVESRGTRVEFELLSLLARTGRRFRRLTVAADGALDGTTLGTADVRDTYGVAVLAVRGAGGWRLVPDGDTELRRGDDLYAVGTRDALSAFAEAVA